MTGFDKETKEIILLDVDFIANSTSDEDA